MRSAFALTVDKRRDENELLLFSKTAMFQPAEILSLAACVLLQMIFFLFPLCVCVCVRLIKISCHLSEERTAAVQMRQTPPHSFCLCFYYSSWFVLTVLGGLPSTSHRSHRALHPFRESLTLCRCVRMCEWVLCVEGALHPHGHIVRRNRRCKEKKKKSIERNTVGADNVMNKENRNDRSEDEMSPAPTLQGKF